MSYVIKVHLLIKQQKFRFHGVHNPVANTCLSICLNLTEVIDCTIPVWTANSPILKLHHRCVGHLLCIPLQYSINALAFLLSALLPCISVSSFCYSAHTVNNHIFTASVVCVEPQGTYLWCVLDEFMLMFGD